MLRLIPPDRPWQGVASAFSTITLLTGALLTVGRRLPTGSYLFSAGLVMVVFFNAPFVFKTKSEQYHLLALGASVALAGAIHLVAGWLSPAPMRIAATVVAGTLALSFVPVTQNITEDWAPCSSITALTDGYASDWAVVAPSVRDWLKHKPASCTAGRLVPITDAVPIIVWGQGDELDEHGQRFQWTSDRADILVARAIKTITIAVRRPDGEHTTVRISGDITPLTLELADAAWRMQTIRLRPGLRAKLRKASEVKFSVSPVFVPKERDTGSSDGRRLGVQLRIIAPVH